ncbi:MAG: hypothetical protein NTX50_16660 [Candidatus Sumerlaeota bacterium]|nr:hypothetical protein [Candidatus Sumerlaeota bacterium]
MLLSPFHGFLKFPRSVPRALPWAVVFLPFQGITEHRLHLSYDRERPDLGEKSRLERFLFRMESPIKKHLLKEKMPWFSFSTNAGALNCARL